MKLISKRFMAGILAALLVVSGLPASGTKRVFAADTENFEAVRVGTDEISLSFADAYASGRYDQETGAYTLSEEEQNAFSNIQYADGDAMMISVLFRQDDPNLQPIFALSDTPASGTPNHMSFSYQLNYNNAGGRIEQVATSNATMKFFTSGLSKDTGKWRKVSMLVPYSATQGSTYYYCDGIFAYAWNASYSGNYREIRNFMTHANMLSKIYFGRGLAQGNGALTASVLNGEVGYVQIKKVSSTEYADEASRLSAHVASVADYVSEKAEAVLEETEGENLKEADWTGGSWSVFTAAKTALEEKKVLLEEGTGKEWEVCNVLAEMERAKTELSTGLSLKFEDVAASGRYNAATGAYTLSAEEQAALNDLTHTDGDAIIISVLFRQNVSAVQSIFEIDGTNEDAAYSLKFSYNSTKSNTQGRIEHKSPNDMNFEAAGLRFERGQWGKVSLIVPYSLGLGPYEYYCNGSLAISWPLPSAPTRDLSASFTDIKKLMSGNITTIYFGKRSDNAAALDGAVKYIEIRKVSAEAFADTQAKLSMHNAVVADYAQREMEEALGEVNALRQEDWTVSSWNELDSARDALEQQKLQLESGSGRDWEIYRSIADLEEKVMALSKFDTEALYADGCNAAMGTISVTEDQAAETAVFTAQPADFYILDGWYRDAAAQTLESTQPVITCNRENNEKMIRRYAKFSLDVEKIDNLIQEAKRIHDSDTYEQDYTEATREALAPALQAAESDPSAANAVVLEAALEALETSRIMRYGAEDGGYLTIGEKIVTDQKDLDAFNHIQNLSIDVVYKLNRVENANIGFVTLAGDNGQFLTVYHNPAQGRTGHSVSINEQQDTNPLVWSGNNSTIADEAGKWEKLTFSFIPNVNGNSAGFSVARDGALIRSDMPFPLNGTNWEPTKTFLLQGGISKVLIGSVTDNCGVPAANVGGAIVGPDQENVVLKYVKVRSSALTAVEANNQIDAEVQKEYQDLVDRCNRMTREEGSYTQASWDAFQAALTENSEQEDGTSDWTMLNAIDALTEALNNLSSYSAEAQYADGSNEEMGAISAVVAPGDGTATFTAVPNQYYQFVGWYSEQAAGEESFVSALEEYTYNVAEHPVENVVLYAKFRLPKFTLHVSSEEESEGSVRITGADGQAIADSSELGAGTQVTVTPQPAEKFRFLAWEDANGEIISRDEIQTFTSEGDETLTYIATFRPVIEDGVNVALKTTPDLGTNALNNSAYIKGGSGVSNNGGRYPINYMTDGIIDTAYCADFFANSVLQIDLGAVIEDIEYVELYRYWTDSRTYFKTVITVSETEDFEEYTVIYNANVPYNASDTVWPEFGEATEAVYTETSEGHTIAVPENVSARYVRIYMGRNSSSAGGYHHLVEFKVHGKVNATSTISVTPEETTLEIGDTTQLSARQLSAEGTQATYQEVIWQSLNPEIAIVSEDGEVTALEEGTATIYAISKRDAALNGQDAAIRGTCTITIKSGKASAEEQARQYLAEMAEMELSGYTDNTRAAVETARDELAALLENEETPAEVIEEKLAVLKTAVENLIEYVAVGRVSVTSNQGDGFTFKEAGGEDGEFTLTAVVSEEQATDVVYEWKSDNEKLVINGEGRTVSMKLLEDAKPGKYGVTITVTAKNIHNGTEAKAVASYTVQVDLPYQFTADVIESCKGMGTVEMNPTGGKVRVGEEIEITAVPQPGYFFTKWYADEAGTRLYGDDSADSEGNANPKTITVVNAMAGEELSLYAGFARRSFLVKTGIVGNTGGSIFVDPEDGVIDWGGTVAITAAPENGYKVEGWYSDEEGLTPLVPGENIVISGEENSVCTISNIQSPDMAVYVKFVSSVNKEELKQESEESNAITNENNTEYTAETWTAFTEALHKAEEVLKSDTASQEEIEQAIYELRAARAELACQYKIIVSAPGEILAGGTDSEDSNIRYAVLTDKITITAPAEYEGKKFAYWEMKLSEMADVGKIVCYSMTYKFYVINNMILTPIYEAEEITKPEPQVSVSGTYNRATKKATFSVKRSVPLGEGYSVVEYGVVLTDSEGKQHYVEEGTEFDLTSKFHIKTSSKKGTSLNGTYAASMSCSRNTTWYVKGYLKYMSEDEEDVQIKYTEEHALEIVGF